MLVDPFAMLPTKDRVPSSARVLNQWVQNASTALNVGAARTEVETIDAPRVVKPRRFDVILSIRGVTWRRIQVEVAFDEGHVGDYPEQIPVPTTQFFDINSPAVLVGISMNYQVAQKLHACTDPHQPPNFTNDRVRDVVDLTLMKETFYAPGHGLAGIRDAAEDTFMTRASEAVDLGRSPRTWPTRIRSNPVWEATYQRPAEQAGLTLSLQETISGLNDWIDEISLATY